MIAGLAAATMLAGCATGSKGPSAEDQINQALASFKKGMEAHDLDTALTCISPDFSHYEFGNKDSMRIFVQDVIRQGDLDDCEITLDGAQITVDGDTATVYPVEMVAVFGSARIEFQFKKEADGQWRATGMEVEGI